MVINTGRSGQYQYYKCSNRIKKYINCCDSPAIPKQQLESIILKTLKEQILNTEKIDVICNIVKEKIKNTAKGTKKMEQTNLKNEIDLINKRSRLSLWKFGDKKKSCFQQ